MSEMVTVCHDCNQSTSGMCWRHNRWITIRVIPDTAANPGKQEGPDDA